MDWWEARGAVLMAVFGVCALLYADNWAKKIFGFLIAGGCGAYDFHRIRQRQKFKRERRARVLADSDGD